MIQPTATATIPAWICVAVTTAYQRTVARIAPVAPPITPPAIPRPWLVPAAGVVGIAVGGDGNAPAAPADIAPRNPPPGDDAAALAPPLAAVTGAAVDAVDAGAVVGPVAASYGAYGAWQL
jgi:hypothetical protein